MIKFTGDRTTDRIMNIWADWYSKKYHSNKLEELKNNELDELMYRVGMEDFVSFVLEEFPQMDMIGFDYDVESTWDMFLSNTKIGYDVEEALSEFMETYTIDCALVNEYVDDDLIAESVFDTMFDDFFSLNNVGKKVKMKDRKILIKSFTEGTVESFSTGFSFSPSEYAYVVMAENDEEGHTRDDVYKYVKDSKKHAKDGYLVIDEIISNPRLYNFTEILCAIRFDLEDLCKNADLKSERKSSENDELITF